MSSSTPVSRRTFFKRFALGTSVVSTGIGIAYSLKRGIRYPTLGLEPKELVNTKLSSNKALTMRCHDAMFCSSDLENNYKYGFNLRAFAPEPSIDILASEATQAFISINNLATDAILSSNKESIVETTNGISRTLSLTLEQGETVSIKWKLPYSSDFNFASIGDSGGDKELAWCLQRAHQLGAKFLLHLGDFNYQAGDYQRSIELFRNSQIPCYVSIGNHDFHDEGNIYASFLQEIGPLNNAFTVGNTRFVNLDTAASTFPYSAGLRGKLIDTIEPHNGTVTETVAFTHRPLHDPLEGSTHDIGNEGERDWLINALKRINVKTLLSGHIHIYDRRMFNGIDNIIAGQGLGHQDLITQQDVSKMILGHVAQDGRISFSTKPLAMPMPLHCHPRVNSVKDSLLEADRARYETFLKEIDSNCV